MPLFGVDEQLRKDPGDLVALMRAGRLSRERVAIAAYLGDQRALATGVEPWVPALPPLEDDASTPASATPEKFRGAHPAQWVMLVGELTNKQRAWLACLWAEYTLEFDPPPGYRLLAQLLQATRDRCRGHRSVEELKTGMTMLMDLWESPRRSGDPPGGSVSLYAVEGAVRSAIPTAWVSENGLGGQAIAGFNALGGGYGPQQNDESFAAWQAQAIAAVLLDPEWPPWDED